MDAPLDVRVSECGRSVKDSVLPHNYFFTCHYKRQAIEAIAISIDLEIESHPVACLLISIPPITPDRFE